MYWWILVLLITNFLWAFYGWLLWKQNERLADELIYKQELINKVFKAIKKRMKEDGDNSTEA